MSDTFAAGESPEGSQELVFRGALSDYWSYSQVRDYVLVHPGLGHSMLRLYLLLRSMIHESKKNLPGAGLRRMSIDQLCWLMPGPNDKPLSISTMYQLLAGLEELDLVVPDGENLETRVELKPGEKKLSSKEKAARGILRGYVVQDLPPTAYTGWRNVWDKLNAYRPDWRENPALPPTHTTEFGEPDARGRRVDCVRQTRQSITEQPGPVLAPKTADVVFQKTGTASEDTPGPSLFQKTGPTFQKTGTAGQKTGTDLALTSENGLPKEAPLTSLSLSPAPSASPAPSEKPRARTEREKPVAPKDNPVPATPATAGAREIGEAWAEARAQAGRSVPPRGAAAVARSAAVLLAEGESFELLVAAAADMGRQERVLTKLGQHLEYFEQPTTAVPSPRSVTDPCPAHPALEAAGCRHCAADEAVERQRRELDAQRGIDDDSSRRFMAEFLAQARQPRTPADRRRAAAQRQAEEARSQSAKRAGFLAG
ncbi:hypothetical protein ACFVXH_39785 [Kitasatospora sp. NPDC058184]|uniref:hypothetical protein n=1 Tax=Kitasatospora sp. NPDC058184 TaxID=3346370 RepID=UPI0036D9348C